MTSAAPTWRRRFSCVCALTGHRRQAEELIRWHDRMFPEQRRASAAPVPAGPEQFFRLLAVKRADNLAQHPDYRRMQQEIDRAKCWPESAGPGQCLSVRELSVNGRDLLALGYRGAEIGQASRGFCHWFWIRRCEQPRGAAGLSERESDVAPPYFHRRMHPLSCSCFTSSSARGNSSMLPPPWCKSRYTWRTMPQGAEDLPALP